MKKTWHFINTNLQSNLVTVLLCVVQSTGSSPGRKGFVMAVNANGLFEGTIGGGIMEVKMIEMAKDMIAKGLTKAIIKEQYHDKQHRKNQSGMICSGSQIIVLMPLAKSDQQLIEEVETAKNDICLQLSHAGLKVHSGLSDEFVNIESPESFDSQMIIKAAKRIHIFGAGHVGLALAQQMSLLNYQVIIYDDRPDVLQLKKHAFKIKIIDFSRLPKGFDHRPEDAVAIVSYSYRSDIVILQNIYKFSFAYIGMMGSDKKIESMVKELKKIYINPIELAHVFAPIGLRTYSKTAEEIAVSIAAEIIKECNKNLPTGRS